MSSKPTQQALREKWNAELAKNPTLGYAARSFPAMEIIKLSDIAENKLGTEIADWWLSEFKPLLEEAEKIGYGKGCEFCGNERTGLGSHYCPLQEDLVLSEELKRDIRRISYEVMGDEADGCLPESEVNRLITNVVNSAFLAGQKAVVEKVKDIVRVAKESNYPAVSIQLL